MYCIQVDKLIQQMLAFLHQLGIWQNKNETICREVGRKLFYLIISASFFMLLIMGAIQSCDKNESIFLVAIAIPNGVNTFKLSIILWRKHEILGILSEIAVHSIADRKKFIKINNKLKGFMIFVLFYASVVVLSAVFLAILSLPVFTTEKQFPLNVSMPFDWKNNEIVYWVEYAYITFAFVIAITSSILTLLIWYLMINCSIKYIILGDQIKVMDFKTNRGTTGKQNISEAEKQNQIFQDFVGIIKTHQNIKGSIDRCAYIFAKLFFTQILISGICICASIYALGFSSHDNLSQSIFYSALLLYNSFDIYMIMYFGNEIKLSSDRLSYCLFKSNWLEQTQSTKKCIIIMAEVLKIPHELVIFKLYPLNLATYTSILKVAYSMFNVLQNFD